MFKEVRDIPIQSDECWMKETCKKALNINKKAECLTDSIFCPKLHIINSIYNDSLIPKKLWGNCELGDNFGVAYGQTINDAVSMKQIISRESMMDFVNKGENLFIQSDVCGNGKTTFATNLANKYIEEAWSYGRKNKLVLFVSVPRFLSEMKINIQEPSEYYNYVRENIHNANLVIWDDIAVKTSSEFELEQLFTFVDSRLYNGKANIYTSNNTGDEVERVLGKRLYSRIVNTSTRLTFVGKDMREKVK